MNKWGNVTLRSGYVGHGYVLKKTNHVGGKHNTGGTYLGPPKTAHTAQKTHVQDPKKWNSVYKYVT